MYQGIEDFVVFHGYELPSRIGSIGGDLMFQFEGEYHTILKIDYPANP